MNKTAKLTIDVKVTEIDAIKELIAIIREFYFEIPEEMRLRFDEWGDKLRDSK